jgi:hypothetical protein
MMDDDNKENSITDRSIIANAINIANLAGTGPTEDGNEVVEVSPFNFSPPRQILLQQAQSPIVHLQKVFDDVNGYDSDKGAYYNAVNEEGPLIRDEDVVPDNSTPPPTIEVVAKVVEAEEIVDRFVLISDVDIDKLKVAELRDEQVKRGLIKDGKKQELRVRLKEAMVHRVPCLDPENQDTPSQAQIAGFSVTAKWKVLQPLEEVVQEPTNIFASHAPTIPAEDAAFVPVKHNFSKKIVDRTSREWIGFLRCTRTRMYLRIGMGLSCMKNECDRSGSHVQSFLNTTN